MALNLPEIVFSSNSWLLMIIALPLKSLMVLHWPFNGHSWPLIMTNGYERQPDEMSADLVLEVFMFIEAFSRLPLKCCYSPCGPGYLISGSEDNDVYIYSLEKNSNSKVQCSRVVSCGSSVPLDRVDPRC